ncbi:MULTISPECIES: Tim44/TimA family putative adaptor protein [unclassified Iodidimonas]|jgi:predicted lipid-binding transport protein (Tim44 family)|uniref:Tim44/TimA family putative adaptor protein n=1 Tax=unclassified Iodidimonas TaxID=2626145 RepID=UPI0024830DD1|nr:MULTISPECIES: Tim44/TimA family putative adaptor protein [unclassified Iodidimonas]
MGEGFQFIDIILLAMVAGFIALRLRSVLGRRTGDEPDADAQLRVGQTKQGHPVDGTGQPLESPYGETVVRLEADPEVRKAFRAMRRINGDFDPDHFYQGAKAVYPMILDAFWQGNRDELRGLLSPSVYADFEAAITAREQADHKIEGQVIDLADVKIVKAELLEKIATITMEYEAEIVSVTKNAEDEIIEGNSADTVTVHDIWTFERDLGSDDPAWLLVSTSSA